MFVVKNFVDLSLGTFRLVVYGLSVGDDLFLLHTCLF